MFKCKKPEGILKLDYRPLKIVAVSSVWSVAATRGARFGPSSSGYTYKHYLTKRKGVVVVLGFYWSMKARLGETDLRREKQGEVGWMNMAMYLSGGGNAKE